MNNKLERPKLKLTNTAFYNVNYILFKNQKNSNFKLSSNAPTSIQIFKKKQKSNNFHNSINPNSLARYVGLIKNFSPVRNNSNKFNIKKNHIKEKSNEQKKNTTNNNYFQTSSQFIKYKTLKPNLNKTNNTKTVKSINTNNYIINTLNLSEKKIINSSLEKQNETMDLEINIKKLRKEKEELEKKSSAQKKLIQKLIEDNEKLDNKFNEVYEDNIRLKNKLNGYKDTQDQLIMLIKLVQKTGVDVEGIIDKWNNEVENENNKEENNLNENENENKSAFTDIQNTYEYKLDSSFTPITIDENPKEKNEKVEIVPKLNFANLHNRIRNNDNKKQRI